MADVFRRSSHVTIFRV